LDAEEALRVFKNLSDLEFKTVSDEVYEKLTNSARDFEKVSLDAGVVDAKKACMLMCRDADVVTEKVNTISYEDNFWLINAHTKAKNIILATGAYKTILKEPYIQLRGVWGHRIDVATKTTNSYSIHQYVSISPSRDGVLAIGATHNVHYHPEINETPYDIQSGREELLQKARQTIKLEDVKVVKDYMGLRSGSFDYLPLVGRIVDSHATLACCEKNIRIKRPDFTSFIYYPNLYMINGSGGYGFVLAPLLAKYLTQHILHKKEIDGSLLPARFFARWAKRR